MKRWIVLLLGLLLLGCASVERPSAETTEAVFHDALFVPPQDLPRVDDLFKLSPAMRAYLAEHIAPQMRRKGPQMALIDALYTEGELRLEYDSARTRNAAEAFDARQGNCLSLVIMTAAFASEMGLQVRFQDVQGTPAIERNGDFTFVVGHVNLALRTGLLQARAGLAEQSWLIVDFLPGQDLPRQRTLMLDESRIRAMYMNNRAAEELAQGRVNQAYWWVRGAWAQDRSFANLYNTLGVIYRRHGALAEAEQALRVADRMDPGNTHVAGNLAGVLAAQGRQAEAARLAALHPAPRTEPRLQQARQALDEGRVKQALLMLQGELGLTPRDHELHHWMAVAAARMGDQARALRHLELAVTYSNANASPEQHALYAGKLQRLKDQLQPH